MTKNGMYRGWAGIYRGRGLQRHGMGGLNVSHRGCGMLNQMLNLDWFADKARQAKEYVKEKAAELSKKAVKLGKRKAVELGKTALDLGTKKANVIEKKIADKVDQVIGIKKKPAKRPAAPPVSVADQPTTTPDVNVPATTTTPPPPPVRSRRLGKKKNKGRKSITRKMQDLLKRKRRHIFM